jgi:hypothetical protein
MGRSYSIPCGGKRTTGQGRVPKAEPPWETNTWHRPWAFASPHHGKHAIPCIIFPVPRARGGRRPRARRRAWWRGRYGAGQGAWKGLGRGQVIGQGQGQRPTRKARAGKGRAVARVPGGRADNDDPARPRCNNHATQRNGHAAARKPLQGLGIGAVPP